MPKSTSFATASLRLVFHGTPIPGIADNSGAPAETLYASLHTANPAAGDQSTNETAYTGYARIPIVRDETGWVITGNSVSPAEDINFGLCTANPGGPLTHIGIGPDESGATLLLYCGELDTPIAIAPNKIPRLTTGGAITES